MSECGCGVPSKAEVHTEVIVGREGETTDWQMYHCRAHANEYTVGQVIPASDTGTASDAQDWEVLEVTVTDLHRVENVDYDGTVHAVGDGSTPLCGTAYISACEPEATFSPVTCWECEALVG